MGDLSEFVRFTSEARERIPPSSVDWSDSPFAWMRHHGPRTKSKLGRDIVEAWLSARGVRWVVSEDGISHFVLPSFGAVVVHLALLGKEGKLEFANLRQPGLGADSLWLLGVEPLRVRLWGAKPSSVVNLPTYANDSPGYHHCSFDPEDPPAWMTPMDGWHES
jgi:hypothetical protein